jgi:hypothetical protein
MRPLLFQPLPSPCTGMPIDNSLDYCVPFPAGAVTAVKTGDNGSPVSAFPLGVSSYMGCALTGHDPGQHLVSHSFYACLSSREILGNGIAYNLNVSAYALSFHAAMSRRLRYQQRVRRGAHLPPEKRQ